MITTVERIAAWAADLTMGEVPPQVIDLCRSQRRSVLAALCASTADGASRRVLAGIDAWAADGPAPVVGSGRSARVEDALYANAVLSIALDFDDYLCFAHMGHSAVLVPLLLATETGSSGEAQLVAQVIADEVGARLNLPWPVCAPPAWRR